VRGEERGRCPAAPARTGPPWQAMTRDACAAELVTALERLGRIDLPAV
jgi:hypothetical protein